MIMLTEIASNVSPLTAAILVVLISVCTSLFISRLVSYLRIPGPWGLPLVGYYPFLRNDFYNHLHDLTKKHGDVYTINIAGQNYVYIGSVKALKDAHLNKSDAFSYRPRQYSLLKILVNEGLVMMEGEQWKTQRKFFVQTLKDTGLRPKHGVSFGPIEDAVRNTLDEFQKNRGQPTEVFPILAKQCTSALRGVMVGNDVPDEVINNMKTAFLKLSKAMNGSNFLFIGNLAKYFYIPRLDGFSSFTEGSQEMTQYFTKIVEDHKKTFDANQPPRDFVDKFLQERLNKEKKHDPMAKAFTDESLVANLRQAYGDGSYSVAMFILGFLWQLLYYPDVQDALYEELVQVVGTERFATLDDKDNLPLFNSTYKEILRTSKFMSVFPSLEANRDTEVCGVPVPKGYITLVNFWAIHRDPEIYENPFKFDMTRFLPEKDKVQHPVTFGVGKRSCAGEAMVSNEIFLFLTAILRDFKVLPEEDVEQHPETLPVLNPSLILNTKLRPIPRKRGRFGSSVEAI